MIQRKSKIILVLCAFLCQNCSSFVFGTLKKIPVTSNPLGAKVIVDGKEMGYTPLNLRLKRKNSHIVRIEKPGCNPFEIRITREISGKLLDFISGGNYFLSPGELNVTLTKIEGRPLLNTSLWMQRNFKTLNGLGLIGLILMSMKLLIQIRVFSKESIYPFSAFIFGND